MEKVLFILSMVFILASCDNGTMVNPFIGTWENPVNSAQYIITETDFTCRLANGDIYYTGTYTYDETHIKINVNADDFPLIGPGVTHPYVFNDQGILSLDGGHEFLIKIY